MAYTERQKWDRFLDKHPDATANAYFWCSGRRWAERKYCAVLVAKSGDLYAAIELRAESAQALAVLMREAGYRTAAPTVQRLCETAPRSPQRPIQRVPAHGT